MLLQAAEKYNIDLTASDMAGDDERDIRRETGGMYGLENREEYCLNIG